ncbi:hypothetical protein A3B21_04410 [Candidatus Uhrbacteria bacterium RIFCSPLOWO2_01_FULL_47_24]|uniref:Uncharacterized protein n=1 Tax=Candidatus Uhrbacteria bacterium RIFCSPLOWO2_01_FULL_47_24 TaxID=1802401 RepID=A0A1F7UTT3_9BACT|nr:MAG: hypothetical protein A2753_01060 [Candidatus Uhrbacteria bacterium RIFCSPHIGHO2_01_FULL_47_11]OGL68958.1 MAG: hypothetical protein A3D58_00450 [Candidatus Uhrbacteria bacterium RIFCSPHIGHO2_02_FULL_46_47]OGL74925.1 MAG: hypothetical protein A3F52_02055 [Candidatus Uhrbacteria bacterium RIFCSPHIGHO2_12_FULL_47_11]OGL81666.1 MAG: hypothetical protein A3B21_04410 [Candidatus Uhrbacteria bacterium RIFCSPLOWO2_01_FULL_47_24]OGL85081.1 MAG: hypothetical protein A3J03_03905 [Candidatus Uhrbact
MAIKEAIRGTIRGPKEVELEHGIDLPVGSEVSITISSGWSVPNFGAANTFTISAGDSIVRFKRSAGSWKDIPESFIKEVYADRHISNRGDVVL